MKKHGKAVNVAFYALGCPKNIVDSERMLAEIARADLLITAKPSEADVVVINTCAFIQPAQAEALQTIRRAIALKQKGRVKKVIVAGCLPQRLGRQLFEQAEGIDAIIGLGQRDNVARIIKKTLKSDRPAAYLACPSGKINDDRIRFPITPRHWAYLRIGEGCNHSCSFCTIPAIRGRFQSKPQEMVLAEAAELVSAGAVELNIIAQDTTYYGRDLKIKDGLSNLLKQLERITGLEWIRIMYLYPRLVTSRLMETIAQSPKILPYLDIPIQHINSKILKDMGRAGDKDHLYQLIEKLRSGIPNLVLRTTIIVGFPGETEQQFDELLGFIRWAKFDALGCFPYYREAGTAAAEMPHQVPDPIKQRRKEQLMLTQQQIAFARNKGRLGTQLTCLVDSVGNKASGKGRFYGQAPDIDSTCLIEKCSANPGDFIRAKVTDTKGYDLVVQQIRY